MLVVNTKEIFLLNLHQNRVHFPAERNAFVLDHQHGRRDVTCKPAIVKLGGKITKKNYISYYKLCIYASQVFLLAKQLKSFILKDQNAAEKYAKNLIIEPT